SSRSFRSMPRENTVLPSGENLNHFTMLVWPVTGLVSLPEATSHSRITHSLDDIEASTLPSGEKAARVTPSLLALHCRTCLPVSGAQRRMAPASSPVASSLPSGEKAAVHTSASSALSVWSGLPVSTFHS